MKEESFAHSLLEGILDTCAPPIIFFSPQLLFEDLIKSYDLMSISWPKETLSQVFYSSLNPSLGNSSRSSDVHGSSQSWIDKIFQSRDRLDPGDADSTGHAWTLPPVLFYRSSRLHPFTCLFRISPLAASFVHSVIAMTRRPNGKWEEINIKLCIKKKEKTQKWWLEKEVKQKMMMWHFF